MASVSDERGLPPSGWDGRKTETCPRCGSHNTKFCYYNNYSLTQPRHFCKACRRYWTIGGSLRSVPVGGSSRSSSHRHKQQPPAGFLSAASSSSSSRRRRLLPTQAPTTATTRNPASPSSSSSSSPPLITSLALDALSFAPVSVVPKTEPPAAADESTATDALGCFTSLLTEPLPAWSVAFGDTSLHGPDIFARDVGLGGGGTRTRPLAWPFFSEEGDGAGVMVRGNAGGSVEGFHRERDAWQVMNFGAELVGFDHGECFASPVMAISTAPGERSAPVRDGERSWHFG